MRQPPISGERELIESLRQLIADPYSPKTGGRHGARGGASSPVTLGMGDDCAIVRPAHGDEVLVTTDFSLETIHFRREWHVPESVGHRCLARGLSDLAAMGAKPLAAFLSIALPAELVRRSAGRPSWRERFFAGFLSLADRWDVTLAGGDTAKSPGMLTQSRLSRPRGPITGLALMDIVLLGSAPLGRSLRRSTAQTGDHIYVTGSLGGAAAELEMLSRNSRQFRKATAAGSDTAAVNPHPHLFPEPRLAVGAWLRKHQRASAAIDISDGLSTDLDHLCEESGLGATIDASAIPIHPIAHGASGPEVAKGLEFALHGGEDYELLFTASPKVHVPRRIAGLAITCIGEMRAENARSSRIVIRELVDGKKCEQPLTPGGWEHFT